VLADEVRSKYFGFYIYGMVGRYGNATLARIACNLEAGGGYDADRGGGEID
jgi:hypothetical protein